LYLQNEWTDGLGDFGWYKNVEESWQSTMEYKTATKAFLF